jgi:uncharacterized membrane protein YebE (DUF533 family)
MARNAKLNNLDTTVFFDKIEVSVSYFLQLYFSLVTFTLDYHTAPNHSVMIGFFEHQYLSYKKSHIKNLLALAKADGHMHPKEEKLLYKIGKRYGLKERQIKTLIDSDEKFNMVVPDNDHDKMNLLYDLILMVHADEVIDKHEVEFCEEAVIHFGMKKELVKWLLEEFKKGTPSVEDKWEEVKKEALEKFGTK